MKWQRTKENRDTEVSVEPGMPVGLIQHMDAEWKATYYSVPLGHATRVSVRFFATCEEAKEAIERWCAADMLAGAQ